MPAMGIRARATPDRLHVCVDLLMDGEVLGHILLDASDAEGFCRSVAAARQNLAEEVSHELDPGSRISALYDPMWATVSAQHSQERHGVLLLLRHLGLGWLSFLLPHHQAAALGQELMDGSKLPPVQR